MKDIFLPKRIYFRYLGIMYWFIHWTDAHRLLGVRASFFIRLLSLGMIIVAWIQRWQQAGIVVAALIFLWIQFSYWRGRRSGYYRFVGENIDVGSAAKTSTLEANTHIPVSATGVFSLKDRESNVLLKPAEYWQVPLGDHAVMVQFQAGRFLYQFFKAESLQHLQRGWLLFGFHPNPAIAISFLSIWGPEFNEINFSLFGSDRNRPETKQRTIYLTFADQEQEEAILHNLIFDARRVRTDQN